MATNRVQRNETEETVVRKTMASGLVGLLIAGAMAGCGISEDVYNRDVNALKKQLAQCNTDKDQLVSEHASKVKQLTDDCSRQIAALKGQGAQLDAGLKQALDRIRQLEEIAGRQRAVFDKLRGALDALVKAGKLSVAIVRGQFTVQMADKILFSLGSARVKPEGQETLRELTGILASIPERRYQVAGHTDNTGEVDFNWTLSGNRAEQVVKFMLKNGMDAERVSFAGFGPFQPAASNDTPEGRALNRRIEIVLVPDMEEFMAPFEDQTTSDAGAPRGL